MPRPAKPRRPVPLSKQLPAALNQLEALMRKLGMIPVECTVVDWQLDHNPALGLRPIDEETGEHRPHQHDVRYLVWMPKVAHAEKTTGRRGTSDLSRRGGDISEIAKADRITAAQSQFRNALLRKEAGEPKPPSRWPKRPMRSRPASRERHP